MQKPSRCRIVDYKLSEQDAAAVNQRAAELNFCSANHAAAGDVYPALIVRVWANPDQVSEGTAVQLQVFIDGNFTIWATSRIQGDGEGQYAFPVIQR